MMEETERRRVLQRAYNEEHGIIPQTIIKSVEDTLRSTRVADARTPREKESALQRVAETRAKYSAASERDPQELLQEIEQEMRDAAAQLDFERAAVLRDQLLELRATVEGAKGNGGGRAAPSVRALRG
nr:UvrB/UvrC motif-containing protein [Gemmatimonadota bacterium]